jgi:hypothetical protein
MGCWARNPPSSHPRILGNVMERLPLEDELLIEQLIMERQNDKKLQQVLTNATIAEKFDTTAEYIARIAKYGIHRDELHGRGNRLSFRVVTG